MGETIRQRGGEFGTTTGRPRRTGWLDLVALRYAARLNTLTALVVTKLDVLSGLDRIQVCTSYRGADGAEFEDFPYHQTVLHHTTAELTELPGWKEDLGECRTLSDLPDGAREYLDFIAEHIGAPVDADRRRPRSRAGRVDRGRTRRRSSPATACRPPASRRTAPPEHRPAGLPVAAPAERKARAQRSTRPAGPARTQRRRGRSAPQHRTLAHASQLVIARQLAFFIEPDLEKDQQQRAAQTRRDQHNRQHFARHTADKRRARDACQHQHRGEPKGQNASPCGHAPNGTLPADRCR